jgi:Holliday junction resolvasome RuvABC endonuclease subunit
MIIMGLDHSTKSTGISIFDDNKLVHYECITAGSANLYKRIDKMIVELERIITQYKIQYVYLEDVYPEDVKHNIQIYKALTYLQGFILHLLDKYNIKHTFFTASEWRSKCGIHTGRGIKRESLKPKDIEFVKNQFGISVNDDIADGIAIGFAGLGLTPTKPQVIKTEDGFEFG